MITHLPFIKFHLYLKFIEKSKNLNNFCVFFFCNEFINYIHRPEVYAKFLDAFHFPCFVIPEAAQFTTKKPMYEASQMNNCKLKLDIGENLDKYNNIWQDIRYTD